jgi:hypothetical protein
MASSLQSRHSIASAILLVHFVVVILDMGFCRLPGVTLNCDLPSLSLPRLLVITIECRCLVNDCYTILLRE